MDQLPQQPPYPQHPEKLRKSASSPPSSSSSSGSEGEDSRGGEGERSQGSISSSACYASVYPDSESMFQADSAIQRIKCPSSWYICIRKLKATAQPRRVMTHIEMKLKTSRSRFLRISVERCRERSFRQASMPYLTHESLVLINSFYKRIIYKSVVKYLYALPTLSTKVSSSFNHNHIIPIWPPEPDGMLVYVHNNTTLVNLEMQLADAWVTYSSVVSKYY